ncbi:hypothetical protein B0H16DRAFT_1466610 [Mycena metata]|uniref:Uncharacterized protein n=1 Tax=Mycena metata TaxID=1033252 RepID=A0AAD7MWT2_9AGAR|nr:hypothetical protein B0H16DRAFT_1466610 [Mycena metata]
MDNSRDMRRWWVAGVKNRAPRERREPTSESRRGICRKSSRLVRLTEQHARARICPVCFIEQACQTGLGHELLFDETVAVTTGIGRAVKGLRRIKTCNGPYKEGNAEASRNRKPARGTQTAATCKWYERMNHQIGDQNSKKDENKRKQIHLPQNQLGATAILRSDEEAKLLVDGERLAWSHWAITGSWDADVGKGEEEDGTPPVKECVRECGRAEF